MENLVLSADTVVDTTRKYLSAMALEIVNCIMSK